MTNVYIDKENALIKIISDEIKKCDYAKIISDFAYITGDIETDENDFIKTRGVIQVDFYLKGNIENINIDNLAEKIIQLGYELKLIEELEQ